MAFRSETANDGSAGGVRGLLSDSIDWLVVVGAVIATVATIPVIPVPNVLALLLFLLAGWIAGRRHDRPSGSAGRRAVVSTGIGMSIVMAPVFWYFLIPVFGAMFSGNWFGPISPLLVLVLIGAWFAVMAVGVLLAWVGALLATKE